jgi:hypothetical protein
VELISSSAGFRLKGRLSLTVIDPDGNVVDHRDGDNVTCVNGLTAFAAALVWSGIQDQASAIGITSPTYLTPLYGAVGSGSGTVSTNDTQLFSELGRTTVSAGASSPAATGVNAEATWQFYFPQPTANWTVTECGVFANATSATNAGSLLDHWAFSPSVSVPTTNTLLLQVVFSVLGS